GGGGGGVGGGGRWGGGRGRGVGGGGRGPAGGGAEGAQGDRRRRCVLGLARAPADAGALAAAERQVGIGNALFGGIAQPALRLEQLRLGPELGAMMRPIGKQRHLVAGANRLAVDDVVLGGNANQHPNRRGRGDRPP